MLVAAFLFVAGSVFAGETQTPARHFKADFEDGSLDGWTFKPGVQARIEKRDGNAFLSIPRKGRAATRLPVGELQDFVLSLRGMKGNSGAQFRNNYKSFFKSNGDVWIRRPGAMLLRWVRKPCDVQNHFQQMKVVCCGPIVRIYINGCMELEIIDHAPVSAPVCLLGSCLDDVELTTDIPLPESLIALPVDGAADFCEETYFERERKAGRLKEPRVKDRSLLFAAGSPVKADLQVLNQSKGEVTVRLAVSLDRFDDEAVVKPQTRALTLAPESRVVTPVDFGQVKPGFYRMQVQLSHAGKPVRTTPYPVFVGVPQKPLAYKAPKIPVGVCLAFIIWKPLHTKAYWHAIADLLHKHHLNTVVATGGCHREFREIFHRYGIASLVRTPDKLDHPAVIGLFNSGITAKTMKALKKGTDKPVLTCMRGEDYGNGSPRDPLVLWREVKPRVRLLRVHPFFQGTYDLLKQPEDGGVLPAAALKTARSSAPTPYWVLLQGAGSKPGTGVLDNPTPAQIKAQMHLALAYGAKGILFYSLQRAPSLPIGMVDSISLKAVDGKLQAAGEVAALIHKHADLLLSLEPGSMKAHSDNKGVEVVPLQNARGRYVYVVNQNTQERLACSLTLMAKAHALHDVYGGGEVAAKQSDAASVASLKLGPGEGRLLAVE